jgi:hypothetical protein
MLAGGGFAMTCASFAISTVLIVAASAAQAAPDFTGTWRLDESRSVSATQDGFVGPVVWTIAQQERAITVNIARGPKEYTLNFPLLSKAPGSPPDQVPSSRAFWIEDRLVTELAQSIQGQTVITREEWTLQPGGSELIVERLVKIEHGYTMRGGRSYNTAKDTFVKAVR